MKAEPGIDYAKLTQDALRGVVRGVLSKVAETGYLPGNHHFFISFLTQADGVSVSKRLRDQYPEEMTIVIQHQFFDLNVHDDRFEVKLRFNGIPEKLVVPFAAIRVFVDPSAQFAIPFEVAGARAEEGRPKPVLASGPSAVLPQSTTSQSSIATPKSSASKSTKPSGLGKPSDLTPRRNGALTAVPNRAPSEPADAANAPEAIGRDIAGKEAGPADGVDEATPASGEDRPSRPALRAVDTPNKEPATADVVDINSFRKK
jgi:uncharacterized protein